MALLKKQKQIPRRFAPRNDKGEGEQLQVPRSARDDNKKSGVHASDASWINSALASYGAGAAGRTVDGLVAEVKLRVAALIADVDAPENGGTRKRTAGQMVGLLELVVREAGDQGKVIFNHTIEQLNHAGFLADGAVGQAPRIVNAEATLPMDGKRRKAAGVRMWAKPVTQQ